MHTLFILLKKEFIQFRRNKFIPKMVVMFPVMAMLVISLVTTMDVKNVNVAVVDLDKSGNVTAHHIRHGGFRKPDAFPLCRDV